MADAAQTRLIAPFIPYAKGPYEYVAPYVDRADNLSVNGLSKFDERVPIFKEDTEKIKQTVFGYAFYPFNLLNRSRHSASEGYHSGYDSKSTNGAASTSQEKDSYLATNARKAGERAGNTKRQFEDKVPVFKEDSQKLGQTLWDYAFYPLNIFNQSRHHATDTYYSEYDKMGSNGVFPASKALATTGITLTTEALTKVSDFLRQTGEAAKTKNNEIQAKIEEKQEQDLKPVEKQVYGMLSTAQQKGEEIMGNAEQKTSNAKVVAEDKGSDMKKSAEKKSDDAKSTAEKKSNDAKSTAKQSRNEMKGHAEAHMPDGK